MGSCIRNMDSWSLDHQGSPCKLKKKKKEVFIFWQYWVFVVAWKISLVVVSGGYSSFWCTGFTLWWLRLLGSVDCRYSGSVAVAQGLSCSAAYGNLSGPGIELVSLELQSGFLTTGPPEQPPVNV